MSYRPGTNVWQNENKQNIVTDLTNLSRLLMNVHTSSKLLRNSVGAEDGLVGADFTVFTGAASTSEPDTSVTSDKLSFESLQ